MQTEAALGLVNLGGVAALAFLIWYVKQFLSSQITGYADEFGKIDARLAKIDTLEAVERRLKQVAGDVELSVKRRLDSESLARLKDVDFRERQLAEFYWPLYLRLQMDNALWEWLGHVRANSSESDRRIAGVLEERFVLPNHREAVKVIQSKIHLMAKNVELEQLLLAYVRHVAVFDALRELQIRDRDPIHLGQPWPQALFPRFSDETKRKQEEFDRIVHDRARMD